MWSAGVIAVVAGTASLFAAATTFLLLLGIQRKRIARHVMKSRQHQALSFANVTRNGLLPGNTTSRSPIRRDFSACGARALRSHTSHALIPNVVSPANCPSLSIVGEIRRPSVTHVSRGASSVGLPSHTENEKHEQAKRSGGQHTEHSIPLSAVDEMDSSAQGLRDSVDEQMVAALVWPRTHHPRSKLLSWPTSRSEQLRQVDAIFAQMPTATLSNRNSRGSDNAPSATPYMAQKRLFRDEKNGTAIILPLHPPPPGTHPSCKLNSPNRSGNRSLTCEASNDLNKAAVFPVIGGPNAHYNPRISPKPASRKLSVGQPAQTPVSAFPLDKRMALTDKSFVSKRDIDDLEHSQSSQFIGDTSSIVAGTSERSLVSARDNSQQVRPITLPGVEKTASRIRSWESMQSSGNNTDDRTRTARCRSVSTFNEAQDHDEIIRKFGHRRQNCVRISGLPVKGIPRSPRTNTRRATNRSSIPRPCRPLLTSKSADENQQAFEFDGHLIFDLPRTPQPKLATHLEEDETENEILSEHQTPVVHRDSPILPSPAYTSAGLLPRETKLRSLRRVQSGSPTRSITSKQLTGPIELRKSIMMLRHMISKESLVDGDKIGKADRPRNPRLTTRLPEIKSDEHYNLRTPSPLSIWLTTPTKTMNPSESAISIWEDASVHEDSGLTDTSPPSEENLLRTLYNHGTPQASGTNTNDGQDENQTQGEGGNASPSKTKRASHGRLSTATPKLQLQAWDTPRSLYDSAGFLKE